MKANSFLLFLGRCKDNIMNKNYVKKIIKKILPFVPSAFLLSYFLITVLSVSKLASKEITIMLVLTLVSFAQPIIGLFKKAYVKYILAIPFLIVVPRFSYVITESLLNGSLFLEASAEHITNLNVAFYYILAIFIFAVTTRSDIALIVTTIIPACLGIANNISLQARDLPVYPWDILSAKTAFSVVDNYEVVFSPTFKFCIFSLIAVVIISIQLGIRLKYKKFWIGFIPAIAAVLLFSGYINKVNTIFKTEDNAAKNGFYPYLYSSTYLYKYNGTAVTFLYTLKYLQLQPPSGYDSGNIEDLYNEYKEYAEADADAKKDSVRPNIIVIMNEALSEPAILGDFKTNIDYMPFIHSLMNSNASNVDSGYLYVSVKGGNTPNSEFEFLTGMSMAFLPHGSIPYQQFIHGNTQSLVSQLNELGYKTIGMHNYAGSGWQRDEVYEYFGFDNILFSKDFRNKKYIRSYLSDKSMYDEIIMLQNEKNDDEPLFVFGVTMQNHGDYANKSNKSFIPKVQVLDNQYSYISYLNNYLSLLYESDAAFEDLVEYYSSIDEPTVIIMFGDHQTNDHVMYPILAANGINLSNADLAAQQNRYKTPYVLWANYHLGTDIMPDEMSLSYLGGLLMDTCSIPLTPFQIWQKELIDEYPILNAFCYFDAQGNIKSISEIKNVNIMNTYSQIQYNLLFDKKHLIKKFYSPVIK